MVLTDEDRAEIKALRYGWMKDSTKFHPDYDEAQFLAGMRAGLERAAKVVDDLMMFNEDDPGGSCATAIRALITPSPAPP